MGCGGLCGTKPGVKPACGDCAHSQYQNARAAAWSSFLNPWAEPVSYPPVGANPYDESLGLSGGDLSLNKNSYQPPITGGTTSTGGGIPAGAWGAIDAGISALGQFGQTLSNNDIERQRINAQAAAAAAGASDAVISALGGRAPQYTQSNSTAPGDTVRYGSGGGSSGSSSTPWLIAAGIGAALLLAKGGKGLRL